MQLTKVISTSIDKVSRRLVKILRFGNNDVQEPFQANNFGVDSNPIAGMVAVYSATSENGANVIVGYLNKNQMANPGEIRIFSTDSDGNLKTYLWLTADGEIKIGGDIDNAMRYSPLKDELDNFKTQIQAELVKIATGITGVGGAYVPGTLTIDISGAKINEIKTP